jgi:dipeptidyl aminopeptidase/acylaminoacyl peptidase
MDERQKLAEEIYDAYLNRHGLVTGGAVPANWTREGLWFVEGAPEKTVILQVDLNTGKTAPLFDMARVRAALRAATGQEPGSRGLPFDHFTRAKDGRIEFGYGGARWRLDPATSEVERMSEIGLYSKLVNRSISEAERLTPGTWLRSATGYLVDKGEVPEALSPSGEWFASVRSDNIMLRSTQDGRELPLTSCGTPDRFWDIEAPRCGNLPSLRGMTFHTVDPWSPDSLALLAYRRDITEVFRIPRIHWLKPFEEVDTVPYQKAGAKLDRIEPVVIDVRSGRQVPVGLTELEDRYIQWLTWHPNESEAFLIVYTRDLKSVQIVAASRETGAIRTLMTESAPTAVKVQLDEVFSGAHGFHLLPDGEGFLWLSTRDGWNHLYRYDMKGRLLAQLTCGNWPVQEVSHIAADGFVYFTAAIDTARPYDLHVCRISLNGGKVEQLTQEKGIHDPRFAPGGQAFLDSHSSVERPLRTDLVKADGTLMRVLSEMDTSRFKAVGYTPAEEFTVKAADDKTELWGVMYKPFDFDPSRAYPVIEFIYGGPQTTVAQRFFAINSRKYLNLLWALAQLGYITVCLDARGTPGRSKAFQDVVHGNWAAGIADHAGAIRQLCTCHSWMDAQRVGIYGHSWGGYASTCALMQAPDTYHAAVSSEPGYDPWHYILSEPYLDLPQKNRAAYEEADLIRQAAKIQRPLMIVTGTRYNPVTSSVMKMTRALIEAGIDHECVIVPDATHHFVGVEEDYLLRKLTGFFDRHVKNRRVG